MNLVKMAVSSSELPESIRGDIRRYQDVTEKLRLILLNKQQVQLQLSEVRNALKELEKLSEGSVYKLIGNVMVSKKKDEIVSELNERQETLEVRLKSLEKQESLLRKQLEELEKKLSRKLGGPQTGSAG